MKTGLSLSLCIRDIITDRVQEDEVEKIITGTLCTTPADWDFLTHNYKHLYWQADPSRAEALVYKFIVFGKIDQPRLRGEEAPNIAGGHWLGDNGFQNFVVMGYHPTLKIFDWTEIEASTARDAIDDAYGQMGENFEVVGVLPSPMIESRMRIKIREVLGD